jgi:DNA-binding transcriptional LysR family regulator
MNFDFDLVDLRLIINVIDTLSLTRGAESSHMSTPAASARIKKMEEALKTQLFYRTTRGFVPTASGHTVLRHALLILNQVEQLVGELSESAQTMKGNIRLFANTISVSEFVPPALQKFLLNYPGVNIDLQERASSEVARALKQGLADIGIFVPDALEDGIEYLSYRTETLVLITPPSHPLAASGEIDFAQTQAFDFVSLNDNTGPQLFAMRAAAQENFVMKVRVQANNFEALSRLVMSGVGIGVVPQSVALRHLDERKIAMVTLRDSWATREVKIAVRNIQALSVAARALVDELLASSADQP